MVVRIPLKVYLRKAKHKDGWWYYITIPKRIVEALGLEKYVDKEITIILELPEEQSSS